LKSFGLILKLGKGKGGPGGLHEVTLSGTADREGKSQTKRFWEASSAEGKNAASAVQIDDVQSLKVNGGTRRAGGKGRKKNNSAGSRKKGKKKEFLVYESLKGEKVPQ